MTVITCTINTDTHKVVPIEPTKDQVYRVQEGADLLPPRIKRIYKMFIAAAPPYPADVNCKEILDSWIPCSERLPDREGYFDVFVRSPGESIYNGRQADVLYCDSRWQATLQYGQHVSHWRPLPLPAAPKGE